MNGVLLRVPPGWQIVFRLPSLLFLFIFLAHPVRAQVPVPPQYPGISPVKPLFDLPLVAPSVWPNQIITQSGTCQAPIRMMRNCSYFKLVYANSTNGEPWSIVPNAITIRASLVVLRPNKPASIRQVTFNGGNTEITLGQETVIVSDKIPEYWDVSENAKAYVRTFVRMPTPTSKIPCFTYFSPLTGEGVRWVASTTDPQDLTMASWPTAAFNAVPETQQPYYPVAIIGDADPTLPSVAFIGSSSTASLDGFAAVGFNKLKLPYVILSTGGWSAWRYEAIGLRARVDASCTHIIEQFGRNDLGEVYNPNISVSQCLDPIKGRLTRIWQRHKMQGSWVAQVTVQPRVRQIPSYIDPAIQEPYPVEEPLRQPLNSWIRDQVNAPNTALDYVYEYGDMVEYFENGVRTNRWKFLLNDQGVPISITGDGLHLNVNGVNLVSTIFAANQFPYDSRDWIAPCLASAIIPKSGARIVLNFNEAKNPPLVSLNPPSGFVVQVNYQTRTLYRAQMTGPKEITLWLTGKPILQSDLVMVGYLPDSSAPVTDSAPLPNPVAPFGYDSVWNNSTYQGTETAPSLVVSGVTAQHSNGQMAITVSLTNKGGTTASLTEILTATLNNAVTSTSFPASLGEIGPQEVKSVTLTFPDLPSGVRAVLRLSAKHSQGSSSISAAVTVP